MYDHRVRVSPSPPSNKLPGQNIIGFNAVNQAKSQYASQPLPNNAYPSNTTTTNRPQASNLPMPGIIPQGSIPSNNLSYDQSAGSKNMPYESQQPLTNPVMERPLYPNPYYSTNPVLKSPSVENQPPSTINTMPYMEMQKVNSQDSNGQVRSGSNSAPRSNIPPYNNREMGYQPQQPYYNNNQPYMNQGNKMGGYENRSYSPHQNKPYSQNYGNQRPQHGGYYSGTQDRSMGSGFGGGYGDQMMGNNPRHGGYNSHSMGNRPHNNHNNGYNKFDYRNQPQNYPQTGMGSNYPQTAMGQNYPPTSNYPPTAFNQAQED